MRPLSPLRSGWLLQSDWILELTPRLPVPIPAPFELPSPPLFRFRLICVGVLDSGPQAQEHEAPSRYLWPPKDPARKVRTAVNLSDCCRCIAKCDYRAGNEKREQGDERERKAG